MIKIDMWYNDKKEQATGLDICFNGLAGFYSGNIEISGKTVVTITPTAFKKSVKHSRIWQRKSMIA